MELDIMRRDSGRGYLVALCVGVLAILWAVTALPAVATAGTDTFELEPGTYAYIGFNLDSGDSLDFTVTSTSPVNVYLMDSVDFSQYSVTGTVSTPLYQRTNVFLASGNVAVPSSGNYYLVTENLGTSNADVTIVTNLPLDIGWLFFGGALCLVFSVIWLVVWILIAIWVYKDAEKRGKNGALWLIVVILLGLIGLIIWLVVRPPEPPQQPMMMQPGYYPPYQPSQPPSYPPYQPPPQQPPGQQ